MSARERSGPGVHDLLLVIAVAVVVIGLAMVSARIFAPEQTLALVRGGVITEPTAASHGIPARLVRPDGGTCRCDAPWSHLLHDPVLGTPEPGARRTYLLEMAARLRRTTLGSQAMRGEGVDPDIYTLQWHGAAPNP